MDMEPTLHGYLKIYSVDGKEDKYMCAKIHRVDNKPYMYLLHYKNSSDNFWYDPSTKTKLDKLPNQSK